MKHRKSSSPYRHHHHHHQHHQNRYRNHHHPNLGVQVGEKNKRLPRIKFLCKEEKLILAIRRWDDLWKWMLWLSFLITTITHLVGERENGRSYFYSAGEWTGRREGWDLHFSNIVIQISWWSSSQDQHQDHHWGLVLSSCVPLLYLGDRGDVGVRNGGRNRLPFGTPFRSRLSSD